MSTLAAFVGIVLFGWGIGALYNVAVGNELRNPPPRTLQSQQDQDLEYLRNQYAAKGSFMSTEEYEERVAGILEHGSMRAYGATVDAARNPSSGAEGVWTAPVTQRTVIHVHGAPPGHHLHIHL